MGLKCRMKFPSRLRSRKKKAISVKHIWDIRRYRVSEDDNNYLFEDLPNAAAMEVDSVMMPDSLGAEVSRDPIYNNTLPVPRKTYSRRRNMPFGCLSQQEYENIQNQPLEIEIVPLESNSKVNGRRIVDLFYYTEKIISFQYKHNRSCTNGKLSISNESKRGLGLLRKIELKCSICEKTYFCTTENSENGDVINKSVVWGSLVSGSTYTQIKEFFSTLDIPFLPYHQFSDVEKILSVNWQEHLWISMEEAGREERRLALEELDIDETGTPWIMVYLDGGWSKRSYGHNYNAASGVGVIVGKRTGKLLYLGVRNKFCIICTRAQNKNMPAKEHICYKNWSGSSAAMESDIIVEGFNQSIELHNIKYLKFVADGDSSVYCRIKQKVTYGQSVEKIECVNHIMKNFGKALHKIKNDTSVNINGRKLLTVVIIKALQKDVQRLIYIYSNDVEKLKKSFSNIIYHAFGNHDNCDDEYCQLPKQIKGKFVDTLTTTGIIYHIQAAIENLQNKAHKLIANENNNKAELYMSLLAKFNCGKRLNLTQKNSFQTRSYLAGLRYNEGLAWQRRCWKTVTGHNIGTSFNQHIEGHHNKHKRLNRVTKRKQFTIKRKEKNVDYGATAIKAPLNPKEYESECSRILSSLQVTEEQQKKIVAVTVGQFHNPMYINERSRRLTASNFGTILKMRTTTSTRNVVKNILYPKNINMPAINYGKQKEFVAITYFERTTGISVLPAGLIIDIDHGFLAATPDGFVGKDGLIEIKCLYKIHKNNDTLINAARKDHTLCVEIANEGKLRLKRNHIYYYQIQGQLNISKRNKCYFVLYINDHEPLFIEEILKDEELWKRHMLPKLVLFYKKHVLKEIILKELV